MEKMFFTIELIFIFTMLISSTVATDFDAWLGMTNASFTVGQAFPVSVYVKNKGTALDSYRVVPISTANIRARIFDDTIDNVTPSGIAKTEVEITATGITANENVIITVNSTHAEKVLTLAVSSGTPSLADIDIFSILQIIVLSLIVLLLSKKLVGIS
ncbi:MAG: hypothetical protein QMD12_01700 [Candidatus Aenigmarchaeota archaeon]|nr:hypothetical protein [Candidatus Aenigmarchaeota archaeon]